MSQTEVEAATVIQRVARGAFARYSYADSFRDYLRLYGIWHSQLPKLLPNNKPLRLAVRCLVSEFATRAISWRVGDYTVPPYWGNIGTIKHMINRGDFMFTQTIGSGGLTSHNMMQLSHSWDVVKAPVTETKKSFYGDIHKFPVDCAGNVMKFLDLPDIAAWLATCFQWNKSAQAILESKATPVNVRGMCCDRLGYPPTYPRVAMTTFNALRATPSALKKGVRIQAVANVSHARTGIIMGVVDCSSQTAPRLCLFTLNGDTVLVKPLRGEVIIRRLAVGNHDIRIVKVHALDKGNVMLLVQGRGVALQSCNSNGGEWVTLGNYKDAVMPNSDTCFFKQYDDIGRIYVIKRVNGKFPERSTRITYTFGNDVVNVTEMRATQLGMIAKVDSRKYITVTDGRAHVTSIPGHGRIHAITQKMPDGTNVIMRARNNIITQLIAVKGHEQTRVIDVSMTMWLRRPPQIVGNMLVYVDDPTRKHFYVRITDEEPTPKPLVLASHGDGGDDSTQIYTAGGHVFLLKRRMLVHWLRPHGM